MNNGCFLPEILDEIVQYLERADLYTLLFVNHQFHAHAIHLLYRNVHFYPKFTDDRCRIKEEGRWGQLYRNPQLASHIRHLDIDLTTPKGSTKEETVPSFEKRLEHIVSHAIGLKCVTLSCRRWDASQPNLDRVLTVLCHAKSRPELSLDLAYLGMGKHVLMLNEVLHGTYFIRIPQIQDTLPITSITLDGRWYPRRLYYVSQFRQLRKLRIDDESTKHFDGPIELEPIFRHLPLTHLEIGTYDSKGVIKSFPGNLQTLVIETSTLYCTTWAAVCNLQHLRRLELTYRETERLETPPRQFKSIALKTLCVDVIRNIHMQQIIPPIYASCHSFASLFFELFDTPMSPNLMQMLFSSHGSLSRITITSRLFESLYLSRLGRRGEESAESQEPRFTMASHSRVLWRC